MDINFTFNFWDNLIALFSLGVSVLVMLLIHALTKKLSTREKFEHEIKITKDIGNIRPYKKVVLADVRKYKPFRRDKTNKTYYKQGCEIFRIIPEYGVSVILQPSTEDVPIGLVPFDWIEIVRDHDGEDNRPIIVCKFKGVKWYENFKSPFKEINYVHKSEI